MSDATCLRLRIHGRVQGVGFRESMRLEAERFRVTGWVRNCRDGTVEAVVEGPTEAVEAMLRWSRRGPDLAQVIRVEAEPADGGYADFDTRPTA